ncbi:hypothetical protein B0H12DRAFT_1076605 [Mycena haematopus]|nr:hypothetical protein B0H12DRAFT_1076605 [Mycena haematopus]
MISPTSIIAYATQLSKIDVPGIQDQVRDRLEWTWGLDHRHLDEHLQTFSDTHGIFTDNTVLVFPHNAMIHEVWLNYGVVEFGVRPPHIQKLYKGCTSFEYLVVPIDPASPHPARFLISEVPPHLALCTTSGKIMKAWGRMPAKECDPLSASVIERAKAAIHPDRPPLSTEMLDTMKFTHRFWSWANYVPPSFVSDTSDQTLVEVEEDSLIPKRKLSGSENLDWATKSSSSRNEPKRRLLHSELQPPDLPTATVRMFPSADGDDDDDEDDVISADSHISGLEDDPEELAKASMARGDYEVDRKWLKRVKRWAVGTSAADADEALLIDTQIKEDPREQPRVVTSLDLEKPDYLSRRRSGMTI